MSERLALEVEFLGGVSYASALNDRAQTEWPPHPDRVFQALLAAWGRDELGDAAELEALEWLEALDHTQLTIHADPGARRDVPIFFVPPNDSRVTSATSLGGLQVLPDRRTKRQRYFPAQTLGERNASVVLYVWNDADGTHKHRVPLTRLAHEVTYIGHSSSLVRAHVLSDDAIIASRQSWLPKYRSMRLRVPYRGRARELRRRYDEGRPSLPSTVTIECALPRPPRAVSVFDGEAGIALAGVNGFRPSLEAFPLIAKRLRDALLRTAGNAGLAITELISGHLPNGRPSEREHMAIVPLAHVGSAYADGTLYGVGLIWPREAESAERTKDLAIVRAFVRAGTSGDDVGLLHFGRNGSWTLRPAEPDGPRSLDLSYYSKRATTWTSVLPVAFDRHVRNDDELRLVAADMLLRSGVPTKAFAGELASFEASPTPWLRGAPDSRNVRRSLSHDSPYATKRLLHVRVRFSERIGGPLLLGAGRFRGLGLMRPLYDGNGEDDER